MIFFKIPLSFLVYGLTTLAMKVFVIKEDSVYHASIIKYTRKVLLTACYIECKQNLLCKRVSYIDNSDDQNLVDCFLIGEEPSKADDKLLPLSMLIDYVSILFWSYWIFINEKEKNTFWLVSMFWLHLC